MHLYTPDGPHGLQGEELSYSLPTGTNQSAGGRVLTRKVAKTDTADRARP
jgi:hypothetical protein